MDPNYDDDEGFELENCLFILEKTYFADENNPIKDLYLENPSSGAGASASGIETYNATAGDVALAPYLTTYGIKPVIEVSKEDIQY